MTSRPPTRLFCTGIALAWTQHARALDDVHAGGDRSGDALWVNDAASRQERAPDVLRLCLFADAEDPVQVVLVVDLVDEVLGLAPRRPVAGRRQAVLVEVVCVAGTVVRRGQAGARVRGAERQAARGRRARRRGEFGRARRGRGGGDGAADAARRRRVAAEDVRRRCSREPRQRCPCAAGRPPAVAVAVEARIGGQTRAHLPRRRTSLPCPRPRPRSPEAPSWPLLRPPRRVGPSRRRGVRTRRRGSGAGRGDAHGRRRERGMAVRQA